ncbi:unnamed protein product [Camellia sinensis]
MKKGNENGSVLQFAPFQSAVDEGFWHRLSSLKLNLFGSDDSPLSITESRGDRNKCSVPGILYNTNTLEGFQAFDKQSLLKAEAKKIWEEIHSGKAEEDSAVLSRLAILAADLNLKLMRWRALPSLDLNTFSGRYTWMPGCSDAYGLGLRCPRRPVAMSNLLRQSLYTLDDCLNGGEFKATAAVKSLEKIFPAVEAEGVVMAIPMPGHPVPSHEENIVLEDCKHLQNLIDCHDAVFLLTDTRESRWLPALLCANANKITVTAALGFDSFLVICHGAGPLRSTHNFKGNAVNTSSSEIRNFSEIDRNREHRLGCYFCNDVVAPIDSTANCTLDQQCTVTWPGLAPIASALAVELLVGILHHPHGLYVKAEFANSTHNESTEQPLGILPHQIRGLLSQFSQMIIVGHSSKTCSACCCTVVSEYWERGMDFVLQAINHPTFLEDLTGRTELMKSASSFELDWDDEMDDNDNNDNDCVEILRKSSNYPHKTRKGSPPPPPPPHSHFPKGGEG